MPIPCCHNGLVYSDFMATLARLRDAKAYLEVGVQDGINLAKIHVERAIGVDPAFSLKANVIEGKRELRLFEMTSDTFFAIEAPSVFKGGIDLAFLDGMHLFEFLLRDVYNTERMCHKGSLIAIHDCLPLDGEMIERVNNFDGRTADSPFRGAWTGDVWKIIPIMRKYRPDVKVILVDCAPTGLVFLTNLDPSSRTLENRYLDIIEEFKTWPNNRMAVEQLYAENVLIDAKCILSDMNHSTFFRI